MSGPSPPATGPVIMDALIRIEHKLDNFMAEARAHWLAEEARMRLVDQFVTPQLDLAGTLAGLRDALIRQRETLHMLDQAVREEQHTVYTAMRLRLGARDLERPDIRKKAN